MDRAWALPMRIRLLPSVLVSLPLFVACAAAPDDGLPTPYDDEFPVSEGNINEGAPANDSLPDDNKADAIYPAKFEVGNQSPVKSQGSRGVCSIFSATAQVENLYIAAGMPVADADFSEQYLQWAAKNLSRGFPNTEGSSSEVNIRTVVNFGTVKEAEWPYESFKWTTANDPACTDGENLPTKCYTNGEPPASVAQARKYKLPSSRWINTNSIKAHIHTKKTGVNVGMTFFYQSWNHRLSELPIDNELWRKGIVTYPNGEDKTKSLAKRAGHAIHIIGWDDNLEVVMRDKDGNPVLDAQGNPRKEKGFWLFKNSWGTASFGVDHPTGAGYGWLSYRYVQEYGSAVAAELPELDTPVDPEPEPGTGTSFTYTATPNAAIPDNNPAGVSSTIAASDTGTVSAVEVTVDITHTYSGDLRLSLTKGPITKVLQSNVGGSADDIKKTFTVTGFDGVSLTGDWTLKVVDTYAADVGTLNSWSLEVTTR